MAVKKKHLKPIKTTSGPKHHFFGYYDKEQWDVHNRYLLTHEVDFIDRPPEKSDESEICLIDTINDYKSIPISSTKAWCWQQGSMLQWLSAAEDLIIYNDRIADRFVAKIINKEGKLKKTLPRPIYTVSNDDQQALSLNFSRNAVTRPGYGYNGLYDLWADQLYPEDDGIYLMDLNNGNHELIISLKEIAEKKLAKSMKGVKHWFNHLLINPDDERFIFLHRWRPKDSDSFKTRLCTANLEGTDIFISNLKKGSHFIWKNNKQILIWGYTEKKGYGYYLIEDKTDKKQLIGKNVLTKDGHCTISNNGQWMLTDEYADENNKRNLILYEFSDNLRINIGRFYSPPDFSGELRCDLHPRWDREDKFISIDSLHEGERQQYMLEVKNILCSY